MEKYIEQHFSFSVPVTTLARRLRLEQDPDDEDFQLAGRMLAEALACARPKFAYGIAAIESKGEAHVVVDGHRIDSALVRSNLDRVHRMVPYVATCGTEIDDWSRAYTDPLEHYWADEIKGLVLAEAVRQLRHTVLERHFPASRLAGDHPDSPAEAGTGRPPDVAKMSPGSLPEWPVTQQKALFALLDGLPAEIGVRLTDSCLMLPAKSVSGFFFASDSSFVNCRLCPILDCPNRSARYQPSGTP